MGAERKASNKGVNWSETTSGIEIGDICVARTAVIEDEGGRGTPAGTNM